MVGLVAMRAMHAMRMRAIHGIDAIDAIDDLQTLQAIATNPLQFVHGLSAFQSGSSSSDGIHIGGGSVRRRSCTSKLQRIATMPAYVVEHSHGCIWNVKILPAIPY